jgi:hypothetical protein
MNIGMDLVFLFAKDLKSMMNLNNTQFVILSCDSYLESRIKTLRETWAKDTSHVFLIDSDLEGIENIVGYNTPKNYDGIQEKYINFFLHYDFSKFEYYFFADDDTFVILKNLHKEQVPHSDEPFCLGRHLHLSESGMDKWGNNTHYPVHRISGKESSLPLDYASGGSGFILSRSSCNLIKEYLKNIETIDIPRSAHGDVSIGFWMRSAGVRLIPGNNLWWSTPDELINNTWEKYENNGEELTFHYVSTEKMRELNNQYNK